MTRTLPLDCARQAVLPIERALTKEAGRCLFATSATIAAIATMNMNESAAAN